jgi:hypothetical protein
MWAAEWGAGWFVSLLRFLGKVVWGIVALPFYVIAGLSRGVFTARPHQGMLTAVARLVVALLIGAGVSLLMAGIALAILPRYSDAPPFIGFGIGSVVAGLYGSSRLRSASDPAWWRLALAGLVGLGVGLLGGGFALSVAHPNSDVPPFLGLGAGFLTAGWLAHLMRRGPADPVWSRLLTSLLLGAGVSFLGGALASGVLPRNSDAIPFFAIGSGALTAGWVAHRKLRFAPARLWWRGLVALLVGLGLGMLVGGFTTALMPRYSDAPPLLAFGAGLLATGVMIGLFAGSPASRPSPVGSDTQVPNAGALETPVGRTQAYYSAADRT